MARAARRNWNQQNISGSGMGGSGTRKLNKRKTSAICYYLSNVKLNHE